MSAERAVGHTRDAGWEIGVSTTVDADPAALWEMLTGPGLGHWLGTVPGGGLPTAALATGWTVEGGWFQIRSVRPGEKIRLRWAPSGEPGSATTVQVSVREVAPGRTRLSFHQEQLPDAAARAYRRGHWRAVIDALVAGLEASR